MASFLQRDSSRLFLKLLRMFQNAIAALGTQPEDVPYARTGDSSFQFKVLIFYDLFVFFSLYSS